MKSGLLKYGIYIIGMVMIISGSCSTRTDRNNIVAFGDTLYLENIPSQPGQDSWKFIEDLKSPMWTSHPWVRAEPGPDKADLSAGVKLNITFPDADKRLRQHTKTCACSCQQGVCRVTMMVNTS